MPKPPFFSRRRRSTPNPSRIDESNVLDTEITEVTRDRKRETAVTFNVFYGTPDLSRQLLKHVAFTDNASVHTELFEQCGRPLLVQDGKDKGKGQGKKGKEKGKEKAKNVFHACQTVESGLPQFQELAYLAAGFNEELLKLCVSGCAACGSCEEGDDGDGGKGKGKASVASAMVYRPLCCSVDGYEMLEDGVWMRKLMMAIAHLVDEFDTCEKAKKAIGIVEEVEGMNYEAETYPFVNMLAVPVCEPDGECQNTVEKAIDSFMQGILKGLESDNKRSSARFSSRDSFSKGAFDESVWEDDMDQSDGDTEKEDDDVDSDGDTENKEVSPKKRDRPSLSRHMSLDDMQPVRLVVFCGIPIVNPNAPPRHGRLNMLLFTSNWPTEMLTDYGDQAEAEYVCYQRIAAFHEQAILDAANFRCAICPGTETKATALFHSPISFKRDNSNSSSGLQPIRDIVMKLVKYVGGNWKYPDTSAALGLDGFPNITDFVVPICERDSVCEKTALVAAQVFLHMYLPEGLVPLYPDMYPTTDFARIWKKEKFGKNPKLMSRMVGTGLMGDDHVGGQEQHNDTNTKTPQRPPLEGRHSSNGSSTVSRQKTKSWIKGMAIEDFRLAVENGATWDQLKELCFEKLRIVIDFRPPVTPMALATAPTSPVAATPTSETFRGGVLEDGGLTTSFGSSFGYPSSATASWSSAGLTTRGDEGYFTVKKA
ncbi:hypothetical protein GX51_07631 [Blastomyces parvus]|uniref:Uncharacterized protein n=1 Tax=Blastomyces parvus TaxID=2060905 RepID=A0A2B7WK17_9EURO|nr:hypothetical protein GX51_07631 [Blastomyces parvus]